MADIRFAKPKTSTYNDYYTSLGKNSKTSKNFTIAEFLDNSIHSYFETNGTVSGCNISIEFKIIHETVGDTTEQQQLIITDNAGGISEKDFDSVISV
jgi:hypothetical protein